MKKIFLNFTTGVIPLLVFVSFAQAQSQKKNFVIPNLDSFQIARNDKTPPSSASANEASIINSKAIKFFNKEFKNAEAVKWYKINDGFVAHCTVNGLSNKVYYDKKGRWAGTLIYYTDKTMPRDIRAIVKSTYYDYAIKMAQEIHVEDRIIFRVTMEDETSFKIINVIDGEMVLVEDLMKQ
jgi:hypothetical protein